MFDLRRDQPTISFPLLDGMAHRTHHGYESKIEDEPGICSPPLWSRSPPRSPNQRRNYYRSLSPTSKTQAIERGQRELMEMVRNMPESNIELTLKDIVEKPKADDDVVVEDEKKLRNKNVHKSVSRKVEKKVSSGSNKFDVGGLYLKMVFPTSLGSKKNNKKKMKECSTNNSSSKVSPRPSVSADGSSTKGIIDKDWWKKSISSGSLRESDSGVSSINSGSMKSTGSSNSSSSSRSNNNNSRHEMSGGVSCWPFIRRPKIPSHKNKC
ncbi:hypothetical protein RIF29_16694 [Crotalaria pallida]|uniref:Uncharacterized protein n=1 Tax=Crotalaria pallida TaxID=3830 RepID=A0AAN9IFS9_CROPI